MFQFYIGNKTMIFKVRYLLDFEDTKCWTYYTGIFFFEIKPTIIELLNTKDILRDKPVIQLFFRILVLSLFFTYLRRCRVIIIKEFSNQS